jgi:hypothetical protein
MVFLKKQLDRRLKSMELVVSITVELQVFATVTTTNISIEIILGV